MGIGKKDGEGGRKASSQHGGSGFQKTKKRFGGVLELVLVLVLELLVEAAAAVAPYLVLVLNILELLVEAAAVGALWLDPRSLIPAPVARSRTRVAGLASCLSLP